MPKRVGIVPRNVLTDAPLPAATKTYTVISHSFVIDNILKTLKDKGFNVIDEQYTCNDGAQIASGLYRINYGDDPELGMLFAFSNSYDKSLRFRCAIGGFVKINNASILGDTTNSWNRKHTGTADDETIDTIESQIDNAEGYFKQLKADKEVMKKIQLTMDQFCELVGKLYLDLKIINGEQLRVIKKEFEKPSYQYSTPPLSLWTLYNHIIVSLVKAHPKSWMEQQKIVHLHMMAEYQLAMFDDEKVIVKDPNQLDLVEEAERAEMEDDPEIPSQEEINAGTYAEPVDEEELTSDDLEEAEEEAIEEIMGDQIEAEEAEAIEELKEEIPDILPNEDPEPDGELKEEVHVTEEELSEQLHGVNNDEESITMTSSTLDKAEPVILGADSPEEEAEVREALADANLAKPTSMKEVGMVEQQAAEESKSILPAGKGWQRPAPVESVAEDPIEEKKPFVSREEGAELRAEKKVAESGAPEGIKPTMTIAMGIEKYGHLLTEEQLADLKAGVMNEEAINIFRTKYNEENSAVKPEETSEETSTATQEVLNTPKVEKVEESVSETSTEDVNPNEEFFMSKQDLDEMYPGVDLEVGFIVTVMDQDFEITTADPTADNYGLTSIDLEATETTEEIAEEKEESVEEEVKKDELTDLDPKPEILEDDFEIGDAVTMAPVDSMLRKKSVKEDLETTPVSEEDAKAEEAIAIMESKVELTPEEKKAIAAIELEIEELYGAKIPFTHKLSGSQYNVTLDTGETIVLTADYIESLKERV